MNVASVPNRNPTFHHGDHRHNNNITLSKKEAKDIIYDMKSRLLKDHDGILIKYTEWDRQINMSNSSNREEISQRKFWKFLEKLNLSIQDQEKEASV